MAILTGIGDFDAGFGIFFGEREGKKKRRGKGRGEVLYLCCGRVLGLRDVGVFATGCRFCCVHWFGFFVFEFEFEFESEFKFEFFNFFFWLLVSRIGPYLYFFKSIFILNF